MSLKAFHLVFLVAATLCSASFGAWSIHQYSATGAVQYALLAALGLGLAVALPIYGVWFLKKTRKVGYV